MKRNDFIDIVVKEANKRLMDIIAGGNERYIVDVIISIAEDNHMLPPSYIPKGNFDIWDSVCEWEDEYTGEKSND